MVKRNDQQKQNPVRSATEALDKSEVTPWGFILVTRKSLFMERVFKHGKRSSGKCVDSLSLKVFTRNMDVALRSIV